MDVLVSNNIVIWNKNNISNIQHNTQHKPKEQELQENAYQQTFFNTNKYNFYIEMLFLK